MSIFTRRIFSLLTLIGVLFLFGSSKANAENEVKLFTPYTNISVPPGETVSYNVELINHSSVSQNLKLSLSGVPHSWSYSMKAGGWNIKELAVLPGNKEKIDLKIDLPLNVRKGIYHIKLYAGSASLPLTITVSKQGTFKTEFTSRQPNMVGHSKSDFNFSGILRNRTAETQLYALSSDAPRGWDVTFKAHGKQVASVSADPNKTTDISIKITPPDQVKAGKYTIPIHAVTNSTSADLDLEIVITGSYDMELTTPKGLLSTKITAGDTRKIVLEVKNTGTTTLKKIKLNSQKPVDWEVTFDPKQIDELNAGETTKVYASIKASKEAIAGDYVTKITARTPEKTSKAEFRISVKTPMIWGWIGILIILIALGSVIYLFRRYGRR